jgi:hypothetical protein
MWVDRVVDGPKWSLQSSTAKALFDLKRGMVSCQVGVLRDILKYSDEFRPAPNFGAFLDVNGIELLD